MNQHYRYRVTFDFVSHAELSADEINTLAGYWLHLWPQQFPVFIKDLDRELFKIRLVEYMRDDTEVQA